MTLTMQQAKPYPPARGLGRDWLERAHLGNNKCSFFLFLESRWNASTCRPGAGQGLACTLMVHSDTEVLPYSVSGAQMMGSGHHPPQL